jgi:toxin ParE1/3/4
MKVRFTKSARIQFLEALAYIKKDNPTAARHFKEKAQSILARLEQFPDSGRVIPEYPELTHREVIVRPYRFFYRAVKSTVWIVAVWHGAQLIDQPEK